MRRSARCGRCVIGVGLPWALIGCVDWLASPTGSARTDTNVAPSTNEPRVHTPAGLLPYLEFETGGARIDDALPLIVGLHSLAGNPGGMSRHFGSLEVRARVVLPRGIVPFEYGWSWLVGCGDAAGEYPGEEGLAEPATAVAALIEHVVANRPTRGRPFVVGVSQGAMVALQLALCFPDTAAGVVSVSGWVAPARLPAVSVVGREFPSIVAFHGTLDEMLSFEAMRTAIEQLADSGLDAWLVPVEGGSHNIAAEVRPRLQALLTVWASVD